MGQKTIAIAVDGMEPSLCERWIENGELPALEALREEGSFGLASCSSTSSAKQWVTHFTGVEPSGHGVTGFLKGSRTRSAGDDAPDARELINLRDIEVLTYPELLANRGRAVGLVNPLPLWPPLELDDGFCVSGMLTPPTTDRWTYPESLAEELERDGYMIDVRYGDRPYGFVDDALFDEVDLTTLRDDMFAVLDARIDFAKRALQDWDLDYFYVLLKSIDIIQHCFWAHMEADDQTFGDSILEAYRRVDALIGWVRSEFPDANKLVFSDHGFQARRTDPASGIDTLANLVSDHLSTVPKSVKKIYKRVTTSELDVDISNPGMTTGVHHDPAMWVLAGSDVERRPSLDIEFEQLTPTLLALLDEPIPRPYSHRPVEGVLGVEPTYAEVSLDVDRDHEHRVEDDEIVSERLHNLGYAEMVDDT